jgi:hypothetical protein
MEKKPFYKLKKFWAAVIALVALIADLSPAWESKLMKVLEIFLGGALVLMIAFSPMTGCSWFQPGNVQLPDVCMNEDGTQAKSRILDIVKYPREADLMLKLTNYELLKNTDAYTAQEAESFFTHLQEILTDNQELSYLKLYQLVANVVRGVNENVDGGMVLILSDYFGEIGTSKEVIYPCDRALLIGHVEDQLQIIRALQ